MLYRKPGVTMPSAPRSPRENGDAPFARFDLSPPDGRLPPFILAANFCSLLHIHTP